MSGVGNTSMQMVCLDFRLNQSEAEHTTRLTLIYKKIGRNKSMHYSKCLLQIAVFDTVGESFVLIGVSRYGLGPSWIIVLGGQVSHLPSTTPLCVRNRHESIVLACGVYIFPP